MYVRAKHQQVSLRVCAGDFLVWANCKGRLRAHLFPRTVKYYLALRQQHDIIKQVVGLRGWLQQGHQQSALHDVAEVGEALGDEKGSGTVQACADFVHEQRLLASHHDLTYTGGNSSCASPTIVVMIAAIMLHIVGGCHSKHHVALYFGQCCLVV